MTTPTEVVTLAVTDGLATITLNRPRASNALDTGMKEALLRAVSAVAADPDVRAVLLRAEGRNFCVGQDLAEHSAALDADPATAMSTVGKHYNPLLTAFAALTVPVVAVINGACVGAGMGLALASDIRIAGETATFATAFTAIGLAADSGLSLSLAGAVGPSRASALLLLGDRVTAAQAHDWGLVHRVVPDDQLGAAGTELAASLATGPTHAYREVKSILAQGHSSLPAALERERRAQELLGATADHRAAVTAFLTKTTPVFTGR
ncbi:enoyl-CoA hydratase-related protein [Nocardia sp. NPDC051990]|uniref:enoyl-CoA hydratase/isomerase family protein n=1 Tax=Nocardia sp. NPDC051990 TaxID=3155285 RepID=UPI003417A69C